MSSLTNVINITGAFVRHSKPLDFPLEWACKDLFHRLDRCVTLHQFDDWHDEQVDWIRQQARNESLERLCEGIALFLRPTILKARLLRKYAEHPHGYLLLYGFRSDRHVSVSALRDVLHAFKAFRGVHEAPDLGAIHIRAMIRSDLTKTFELMFLLGKIATPRRDRCFFRRWQTYLTESQFENFEFDSNDIYSGLDRPQLGNTGFQGVLADPARVPPCCLPHYSTGPFVIVNPSPYGSTVLQNRLDSQ